MVIEEEERIAVRSMQRTVKHWRRRSPPVGWFPGGLLPLIALVGLFWFGAQVIAPNIEADVQDRVGERLAGLNIEHSQVVADGQIVNVAAPQVGPDAITLKAIAKSTQCDTWAGRLDCPTTVIVERASNNNVPAAIRESHRLVAIKTADSIRLMGDVPNDETRVALADFAALHANTVDNQLAVSGRQASAQYDPMVRAGIRVLENLESGQMRWSDHKVSIEGRGYADAIQQSRSSFFRLVTDEHQGTFDVTELVATDTCNQRLRSMLTETKIRFRTASAEIEPSSAPLLQNIADVAGRCDGGLLIEGHTDSRGEADANQALSLARAEAVKRALIALGLQGARITTIGHGEQFPIGSNDTVLGRAQNRRIAISVPTSPDGERT